MPKIDLLRAAWLTARRAGPRRILYRLRRLLQLRLIDPHLAGLLYAFPPVGELHLSPLQPDQIELLTYLVELRHSFHLTEAWDRESETLTLLNQAPFAIQPPVAWHNRPVDDPLWPFRLHSWEWAWSALLDENSRETLLRLWHDWITNVPVGRGLAWEPYPVSRRLTVWSAAWRLLGGDEKQAVSIAQHAAYLVDHLEKDLDNNHLIANAKALAWVGLLFPTMDKAQHWRDTGLDLLWRALEAQVRADGGHVENSSSYHLAVWLDGLETALLCRASGEDVPEETWETLERMGDYALALRRPDGRLPMLNDSIEDEPLPARPIFKLAARAFDRPDFAWAAGDEDVLAPDLESQALSDSGYIVMRSEDTYLLFDAGDLGPPHCPGHGHADALSLELWARGEPLILDPGTYQYPDGRWRDYFRGTFAHSTATVDGLDQSVFVGPFRVADMARGRVVSVDLTSAEPEVIGEHDGYTRLADPVTHRRRICLRNHDRLEIEDTFSGNEEHRITLRFHLALCHVEQQDAHTVQAIYPGGTRLNVRLEGPKGTLEVKEGWVSRTWYRKEPSLVLAYALETALPARVVTQMTII